MLHNSAHGEYARRILTQNLAGPKARMKAPVKTGCSYSRKSGQAKKKDRPEAGRSFL